MTELYEIEVWVEPSPGDPEGYFGSTIVACRQDMPAGIVPPSVVKHAEMLRVIASHRARVKVGWHELCVVGSGLSEHARTVWLDEWTSAAEYNNKAEGRNQ